MKKLIETYIAERVARGEFNGSTPASVRSVLISFARHTAHLALGELCERDVQDWIADPVLRPRTKHSMVTKLKPFVRWLCARDHVAKDFTALLHAPKAPEGLPRYLEGDQVSRLVQACPTSRDRLIVLLMVHLGLRRIEVSRIDMEDIDFRERLISVRGKNGQGQITRSLPLTDEVYAALVAYLAERPAFAGALVRLHHAERRMHEKKISEIVAKLMTETGVKKAAYDGMSGHSLRHTCAQEVLDGGADIRQVQAMLGHRSVQTTEIYLRRKVPGLREAMGGRTYG
jgi:site-specific recombinase XerD